MSEILMSDSGELPGFPGTPEELGLVFGFCRDWPSGVLEEAKKRLCDQAKKLGAEGIIRLKTKISDGNDRGVTVLMSGMAVKKPENLFGNVS